MYDINSGQVQGITLSSAESDNVDENINMYDPVTSNDHHRLLVGLLVKYSC
jgi:hypothetical protein